MSAARRSRRKQGKLRRARSFICGWKSRHGVPGGTLQLEHLLPTTKLAPELISIHSRAPRVRVSLQRTIQRIQRISYDLLYDVVYDMLQRLKAINISQTTLIII